MSTANCTSEPNSAALNRAGRYLTFALSREEYGIEIMKVREIIRYMDVTPVPRAPAYVDGVINLRGQVIPVIDLRLKFGMEAAARTEETCIIVVDMQRGGRKMNMGVVVDRVTEVLTLTADQIDPPPSFDASVTIEFILGLGKVGKAVKILLDIDHVLTTEDLSGIAQVRKEAGDSSPN